MKTSRLLIAAAALMALAGCSTIQSTLGSSAANAALSATEGTLLTYNKVIQPALLLYGQLPTCPQAAGLVCKAPATWAKLQATDAAVTASIVAAQGVLDGNTTDTGQIAAALGAIQNAEISYATAGVKISAQ